MALSGDLKDFGLLQLLTLVQVTQKSGALTLQRAGETATIYFEGGQLTRVTPPFTRSESLATALYKAGKIHREQHEQISVQAPPSEQAIGLLMTELGGITREEIEDFIRNRSLADLYMLLTWPDGVFRFDVGITPPEEDILAPTDLSTVLDKGRNFMEEWQLLVTYVPHLEWPLKLLPEPRQQLSEIRLTAQEWKMVANLVADLPLKEVAKKMSLDEMSIRRLAYRLISAGLADIAQPEAVPQPQPMQMESMEMEQAKGGGTLSRLFGRK